MQPTLKTLCISLATAGSLFAGMAFAADLKPSDDFAAFEEFTKDYIPKCTTCHKLDQKLVGPSYQEVAAKRKEEAAKDMDATVAMLVEKIMKGNAGSPAVYGGAVMTPNTMVKEKDAKKIAEWVLALGSGDAEPAAKEVAAENKEAAAENKEAAAENKEAAAEKKPAE